MKKLDWFGHELPDDFGEDIMDDLRNKIAREKQLKEHIDSLRFDYDEFKEWRHRREYLRLAKELENKAMSEEEREYQEKCEGKWREVNKKLAEEEGKIPELPECPFPGEDLDKYCCNDTCCENARLDGIIDNAPSEPEPRMVKVDYDDLLRILKALVIAERYTQDSRISLLQQTQQSHETQEDEYVMCMHENNSDMFRHLRNVIEEQIIGF